MSGYLRPLRRQKPLGRTLARELPVGSILLLKGTLGAGKTTLVQGMAQELAITEPVTSPTFALAQHYPQGKPKLVHIDLYRLEQSAEADELFIQEEEEARDAGALMAVEWPERMALQLPEAWQLELTHSGDKRKAILKHPQEKSLENAYKQANTVDD